MIVHGHYPSELLKSTIVSIPKDKTASLSNSDNYRGISMFNSIHILFDYVLIDICGDSLSTSDIGYEPTDLTVHPPPPELPRVGSFFSYRCLVFPKKMSSKESLCFSELLRLKDPKTWFFSIFTQTQF